MSDVGGYPAAPIWDTFGNRDGGTRTCDNPRTSCWHFYSQMRSESHISGRLLTALSPLSHLHKIPIKTPPDNHRNFYGMPHVARWASSTRDAHEMRNKIMAILLRVLFRLFPKPIIFWNTFSFGLWPIVNSSKMALFSVCYSWDNMIFRLTIWDLYLLASKPFTMMFSRCVNYSFSVPFCLLCRIYINLI